MLHCTEGQTAVGPEFTYNTLHALADLRSSPETGTGNILSVNLQQQAAWQLLSDRRFRETVKKSGKNCWRFLPAGSAI